MIPQHPLSTHVCLRCRLRLANSITPSKTQIFRYSTNPTPEVSLSGKRARQRHQNGFKRPDIRRGGKLYGYRGHQLREDHEPLNIEALGKPSEVIVLRESRFNIFDSTPEIDPEDKPEKIDILAQLDSERGLADWEEVEANINEIRPKEGDGPRNWEEFDKLVRILQEGFTVSQLARYIQVHGKSQQDLLKEQTPKDPESRILRRSPWLPDVSKPGEQFDESPTRGYYWKSHTSKQRLVLLLVRDCWNLEVPELANGIGEVEVYISGDDLELLLAPLQSGNRSPLSAISEEYITDNQEKIEAFKSRGVIRITTTRQKSNVIIEKIDTKLRSVQSLEFSLENLVPPSSKTDSKSLEEWINSNIDDTVLSELSRLTRTDIARLSKTQVIISCFDNDPESTISNRSEVARRLLLTSNVQSDRNIQSLAHPVTNGLKKGAFVPYSSVDNLPWRDRLRQWTRFTYPVTKPSAAEPNVRKDALSHVKHRLPLLNLFLGSNELPSNSTKDITESQSVGKQIDDDGITTSAESTKRAHWNDQYFTESSAIIGSVIHSHPAHDPTIFMPPQRYNPSAKPLKSFSAGAQNISHAIGESRLEVERPVEAVTMRFLPSPWAGFNTDGSAIGLEALSIYPPVEIRFSVHPETKELLLEDVHAIVQTRVVDLMLPDLPVDLRLQQRIISSLEPQPLQLNQITSFLQQSQLSLTSGQQLVTPPELILPMAKHLCSTPSTEVSQKLGSDVQEVTYMFAGLEYRNSVAMDYKGWRLLYTSVEGGKADGRRGELKLRAVRAASSGALEQLSHDDVRQFVDTACHLAASFQTGDTTQKMLTSESRIKVVNRPESDTTPEEVSDQPSTRELNFLEKASFEELGGATEEVGLLGQGHEDVQDSESNKQSEKI